MSAINNLFIPLTREGRVRLRKASGSAFPQMCRSYFGVGHVLVEENKNDRTKCKQGLDALRQYRKQWDDKNQVFKNKPLHDWCSHAADSFRYGCVSEPLDTTEWDTPINVDTKYVGKTEPIDLSSWDNLLTTSSVTSQQLVDKYFSGSFDNTELNIDYKDYENFVFFGW